MGRKTRSKLKKKQDWDKKRGCHHRIMPGFYAPVLEMQRGHII